MQFRIAKLGSTEKLRTSRRHIKRLDYRPILHKHVRAYTVKNRGFPSRVHFCVFACTCVGACVCMCVLLADCTLVCVDPVPRPWAYLRVPTGSRPRPERSTAAVCLGAARTRTTVFQGVCIDCCCGGTTRGRYPSTPTHARTHPPPPTGSGAEKDFVALLIITVYDGLCKKRHPAVELHCALSLLA